MGTLTLKIEGRKALSWVADRDSITKLGREVEAAAARAEMAPEAFAAMAADELLRGRVTAGAAEPRKRLMTVVYFILAQGTGRADRPGKFRDYLPSWDFEFDLRRAGDGIAIDVTGGSWL
ncbi:MAG TPA: hypothetical protein VMU06_20700 [Stellaceae bacterium]|nr:hypothetical protein [Stellaceae bacterium]